jgi:regulatory protein
MCKPTEKSLSIAAVGSLRRHSASVKQLERPLVRRVKEAEREFSERWVLADAVARFVDASHLDDRRLAVARTIRLRRSGCSTRVIRQKLQAKGIAPALVAEVTKASADEELAAAFVLARKKRVGPYRRAAVDRASRAKELAVLARAGFSFGVAKRVVDAPTDGEFVTGVWCVRRTER